MKNIATMDFTQEQFDILYNQVFPVFNFWKQNNTDLRQLVVSVYFQGLLDGANKTVTEKVQENNATSK